MTDIAYDPALPFALVRIKADGPNFPLGVVEARTRRRTDANDLAETYAGGWVKVVDTTPAPKIPTDADYIMYPSIAGNAMLYARRYGHRANDVWETSNPTSRIKESELLKRIGDNSVTVLKEVSDGA